MGFRTELIGFAVAIAAGAASGCISPPEYTREGALTEPRAVFCEPRASDDRTKSAAPLPSGVVQAVAEAPAPSPPGEFSPETAVRFAIENNPMLAAFRQQLGFAQGAVVIARTYPYNPIAQLNFLSVTGRGVENPLLQAHKVTLDVEILGQRRFRKQAAFAALTRTEWDIATQELLVAITANRAYNTVLYRQRKLEVVKDTIALNERTVEQVKKLVDLGRLRPADLIVARTELDAVRAQLGQARTAIAFARSDLRRQFGTLDDSFTAKGDLEIPLPTTDFKLLSTAAQEKRPDLQSRRMAVAEAEARHRLQVADRYGNPNVGPIIEYNETRNGFYGFQIGGPIPVLNCKKGEILQAQATLARARADVTQFEIQSAQDVQAALARLAEARKWADHYTTEVLPNLRRAVQDMNKLLEQNDPGVDVLKVIGVQRNYLASFGNYLDALFEVSQARADLAAAVGDPAIALGLYSPGNSAPLPPPKPVPVPPK